MLDIAYIAGTIGFFAVMIAYVNSCERLGRRTTLDGENGEEQAP
jgi:hypothetical protein